MDYQNVANHRAPQSTCAIETVGRKVNERSNLLNANNSELSIYNESVSKILLKTRLERS